jgi:DNA-binding response OmpR family regulator
METILVVEDDLGIQKILRRLFESEGCRVKVYGDGQSALDAFRMETPTAVILDLGLPVLSGRDVCREIRRESPRLPVIVVSARTDELEKIMLLELGVDDYITKPFSPKELGARVKAAIRRAQQAGPETADQIHFGDASIDFAKMQARVSGNLVHLSASEFRMLRFLAQNMNRVVSRSEILVEVLGGDCPARSRTMDNLILRLRQKLERNPSDPVHILTVWGEGYRFAP